MFSPQDTPVGSIGTPAGTFPIADVSVYNETEIGSKGGKLVHDLMVSLYGENYMKPMRKWVDDKWKDVRDWRTWVHSRRRLRD